MTASAASAGAPPSAAEAPVGVLAARVHVPQPAGLIQRGGLDRVLDAAAARRLTLISAGPGWGKTSAASGWLAARHGRERIAWVTLERGDNDAASFWNALVTAVKIAGPLPDGHPLSDLSVASGFAGAWPRMLEGLLTLPGPTRLVLDGLHLVEDTGVLEGLELLLRYPSGLRLIVITRSDPPLPLHRLRLEGELATISADELAFGLAEVVALGATEGLDLDPEAAAGVLAKTGGWPAGVRLAAQHCARYGVDRLAAFGGSAGSVSEYLVAEILSRQDAQGRDFLLRTSIVEHLTPSLAEAIVPGAGAAERLARMERTHQFVTVQDPDRSWYAYHPLLRELLEHLLRREHPELVGTCHRRAARCLASHGEPVRGLQHAVAAGDWALAAAVTVTAVGARAMGGERELILRSLSAIPFDEIPPSAPLLATRALRQVIEGRWESADTDATLASPLLGSCPAGLAGPTAALLDLIRAGAARCRGDLPALRAFGASAYHRALALGDHPPAALGYRGIATGMRAAGLLWSGDVEPAAHYYGEAVETLTRDEVGISWLNAMSGLAATRALTGRIDEAERCSAEAIRLAARHGWSWTVQLQMAHAAAAVVHLMRGELDDADRSVHAGLAAHEGGPEPANEAALYAIRALVAVTRGRYSSGRRAWVEAEQRMARMVPPQFLRDALLSVRTQLALGEPDDQARDALRRELADVSGDLSPVQRLSRARLARARGDHAQSAGDAEAVARGAGGTADPVTLAQGWLALAIAESHARHDWEARLCLNEAVALCEPQCLVWPFQLMRDTTLVALCERAWGMSEPTPFRRRVMAALGAPPPDGDPAPLAEPLTGRELEVLAALPSMRGNTEIADQLYMSVNTLKTYLKRLFRKLDVDNRGAAVRRGRELGLIP